MRRMSGWIASVLAVVVVVWGVEMRCSERRHERNCSALGNGEGMEW